MKDRNGLNNRILSELDSLIYSVEEELGKTNDLAPDELDETIRSENMSNLSSPYPIGYDGYVTAEVSAGEMEAIGGLCAPAPGDPYSPTKLSVPSTCRGRGPLFLSMMHYRGRKGTASAPA
ncbi:MAG: hypothetical protein ACLFQZ_04320 [Spirochaetaceae bacterium]